MFCYNLAVKILLFLELFSLIFATTKQNFEFKFTNSFCLGQIHDLFKTNLVLLTVVNSSLQFMDSIVVYKGLETDTQTQNRSFVVQTGLQQTQKHIQSQFCAKFNRRSINSKIDKLKISQFLITKSFVAYTEQRQTHKTHPRSKLDRGYVLQFMDSIVVCKGLTDTENTSNFCSKDRRLQLSLQINQLNHNFHVLFNSIVVNTELNQL